MLSTLLIQNYAIIEKVEIFFSPQQTIITGETGAGKSILLGALGLLMGERADTRVLNDISRKCIVEGVFNIDSYDMISFFREHELDYDHQCFIRREITPQGKSRAFINDSPVPVKVLKLLGSQLIDIHEQFDNTELQTRDFRFMVLDALAENATRLQQFKSDFKYYKSELQLIGNLESQLSDSLKEADYNLFLLEEIQGLAPQENEEETLEQQVQLLGRGDAMLQAFKTNTEKLIENEWSVSNLLQSAMSELRPFQGLMKELDEIYSRLDSVLIEVDDIHKELQHLEDRIETDPEKLQEAEERLNLLNKLLTKHRVQTASELVSLQNELTAKTDNIATLEKQINTKNKLIAQIYKSLEQQAVEISDKRKNIAGKLEVHVIEMLADLGMPHVTFKVEILDADNLTDSGADDVHFLFSANLGIPLKPVAQVASGGERSRLMFAIKSLVASSIRLPTMIFDEIDAGISGAIALKMAGWLRKLSRNHQVICITHSPQIASSADLHYRISKETGNGRTYTVLMKLDESEKIMELAKMLSGDPPSDGALRNAGELLEMNKL